MNSNATLSLGKNWLFVLFFLLSLGGSAQTLTTDSLDYQPGSLATFYATGFQPNETVTMQVLYATGIMDSSAFQDHQPWDVIADSSGNFETSWLVSQDCRGQQLVGFAIGLTSGLRADVYFTDATITVIANTNWSALSPQPTAGDAVIVKNNATLTVNVPNAVCGSLTLGVQGGANNGNGTLKFNAASVLTVSNTTLSGNVVLGDAPKTGSLDFASGGTLEISGAFTAPSIGTFTPGSGTVEYLASGAQTILSTTALGSNYNHLEVSGGGTKTPGGVISLNGNLKINSGATISTANNVNVTGNWIVDGNFTQSAGTTTLTSGATHNISGSGVSQFFQLTTSSATINAGSHDIRISSNWVQASGGMFNEQTSTVTFNGSGNQTQPGAAMVPQLYNMVVNKSGGTMSARSWIITNGITMQTGAFAPDINSSFNNITLSGGTFTAPAGNFNVAGTWTNNSSTTFIAGTGTVTFNGAAQNINGTSSTTFNNIIISGTGDKTLGNSIQVNGTLTLQNRCIVTSSNLVTANSIIRNTTGHIKGNLKKDFTSGTLSRTFEIGTTSYAPVNIAFGGISAAGSLTAFSNDGDHANIVASDINQDLSVNRTWTLSNSGIAFTNYSATFNFNATDLDAGVNTASFIVGRFNSGWIYPTVGIKTATSTQATGVTTFGVFQIGEPGTAAAVTLNPSDFTTCAGSTATFSATASGQPAPSLQWQVSADGVSWADSVGATSNPLTFIASSLSNGRKYRAVFSNNKATVASTAAGLTVNTAPVFSSCPANIITGTDAGLCTKMVTYSSPATASPSPVLSYTLSGATTGSGSGNGSGSIFNKGVTNVTITAHNICSPDAVCSFTVTVNDNEAPSAICKNLTVQLDASGNASITAAQIDNGSSDACGIASLSVAPSSFTCANVGANTVILTVTDNNGNVSTCSAVVTVEDNISPIALCQAITVQLDASGNASITAAQINNGSSDACGIASLSVAPSSFTCANVGANTVILTVTDNNGNVSTCSAVVTVEDNIAPIALCQAITVQLDAAGNASITAAQIDNGSSDACGIASLSVAPNSFTCANVGANTVILTVTDNNGNVSICSAVVTVEDNIAPIALCQAITVQLDAAGNASITAAQIDNGSSDACGIASLSVAPSSFTCANVGANTVILTVTDNNGNVSTCSAVVTVEDNIAPVALCQAITVQLDAAGNASITAAQIDNGSSDACGIASLGVAPSSFTCANVGANTVILTVTDNNGNVSTCSAVVTVEDNIAPIALCQAITVQLDAAGNASITAAQIDNGSSDACGIASLSVAPSSFTCANVGANTVILTVTDNNGNVSTCSAVVTVEDNIAPIALCQAITVQLDAAGNASITAAQINNGSSDACGIASLSVAPSSFSCANVGANTVILTVTDNNGNVSTCSAVVTVEDNIAPIALCQAITVQLDAAGNASITAAQIDNGSSDACGIASLSVAPSSFTCANVGANTVILTVTDNNGNVSTCSAVVTVEDNIAPIALCQAITVQLDAAGNASITAAQIDNGSSDACGIASLSVAPSSFTCANVGANTVILTVTDNNGNSSTCSAVVTVEDNIAPIALCQAITVQLDAAGNASITAAQIDNGSSDACGIASLSVAPSSFTCANVGANTVILTVTDNNGNVSTCSAVVTVEDNIAPIALCQAIAVQLDAAGNASITAAQIDNGSSDACGIASLSVAPSSFTCANVGANTVILTVTDNNGNVSTCSVVVTVEDNIAPVALCQAITVQLDAAGNASITAAQIDNGSSDACGIASLSVAPSSFTCANVGANTVILTVTDNNGNVSTCSAVVTVEDNIAPIALCQGITVQLDAAGNASITAAQIDNGSSDACGIASLSVAPSSFTCANVGANTVILTVTDNNGNVSNCSAVITVEDNIAPIALCQAITVQLDAAGNASITAAQIDNGSSDACGIASLSVAPSSFTCANVGANTVILTVLDNNGNSSTCSAVVTVEDNIAPIALCQAITVQLDAAGNASITAAQIDNGSSDACGIASLSVAPISFTCANVGANTVILTVTDNNGNVSTCSAVVTVEDNIAPIALCQAITVQLDASGNASITAAQIDNGSSDACGIASLSVAPSSFSCANVGANTVILTVLDNNGNSSTCSAVVTVEDNIAPIALCQAITVQLDAAGNASITAAQIDNGSSDACGIASLSVAPSSFTCANVGANTVILTVTDNNGNVSTCSAVVTVEDNIAPIALCQAITVQLDAAGNASITAAHIDNGSSDACGIASLSVAPSSFTCANVGANTVILTVTDNNGNVSTCSAVVTVEDNIAPIALCQAITVQLDAAGNASITAAQIDNGSSDACGIASLSVAPSSFTCANVGANTVILTVTDNNGNVSTCSAVVTVEDNISPIALCQAITVQLDAAGNASITAAQIDNGSSDACGIASLSVAPSSFTCANVGANTVILTVTDNNGNVSTCSAVVTVEDNIAPIALCQAITVQLDAAGNASITAAQIDNGSSDACGIASLSVAPISFSCANVGANTVILTVTDNNGNVSTCSTVVTVEDNIAPIALCQAITVQLDAAGNASITAAQIDNGSSDACGIASLSVAPSSFTCANVGANTVILTVLDNNGNSSTCSAVVTVEDNIAPIALCQAITVQLDAAGNASITAAQIDNGSSDACGIASLSVAPISFSCANVGANTVILTVTDNNGNVSTCSTVVTVEDNIAPIALCQAITVQLDAAGNASITAAQIDNGSSDACGIASLSVAPSSFTCANVGANTVILTVTDNNGNVSTCSAVVTVEDNIAPIALCQAITVQLDTAGNASITAAQIDNGSSDACGIASLSIAPSSFTCANVGANTVILTVTDNNGNSSTCSAVVTVEDNIAPIALCQAITVQLDAAGNASITTAQIDNGSSDACGIASLSVAPSSFTCANVGANTVILTVTDNNGNVSTCSAVVTVEDNIAPIALCQAITVQLDAAGNASITAAQIDNGSSDACGIASLSVAPSSFTCANVGANTVILTVTDNNGNVSTCSAVVTVEDNIAPIALCKAITVQLNASGNASITAAQVNNGSSDACGIASMSVAPSSFSCANVGANTVILTVTDNNGNVSTCSAVVTVEDHIAPAALCKAVTVQLNASGNASVTAAQVNNGSSDACGIATMSVAPSAFTCANLGANTVTLTVTDVNGNVSTCTATVTVQDLILPVITPIANISVNNTPGQCGAYVSFTAPVGTDNCSASTMQIAGPSSGSLFPIGTTTISFRVTDGAGNTASCSSLVTVTDNQAPVVTAPANMVVNVNASGCKAAVTYALPVYSDNCPGATILQIAGLPSGSQFNAGVTTNTFRVTDAYGNTATCSFTVTVLNSAPVITTVTPSPADIIAVNSSLNLSAVFTDEAGGGPYTITYIWDDATANTVQTIAGGSGSMTQSASHTYAASGVYIPKVRVSDGCGVMTERAYQYVVVYVTGKEMTTAGGHFTVPAGSLVSNPGLSDRANIGDVCKSKNQGNGFDGELEFNFQAGNFNFKSVNAITWDYLTISGCYLAIFRGTGTVNGSGNYGILVAQTDRDRNPSAGNRIRIKIWNKNAGNAVVFDTQMGAPDNAVPTTQMAGGNIKVTPSQNSGCNSREELSLTQASAADLIQNYPNPFSGKTTIRFTVPSDGNMMVRVLNYLGEEVGVLFNDYAEAGKSYSVEFDASNLTPGIYFYTLQGADVNVMRKMLVVK